MVGMTGVVWWTHISFSGKTGRRKEERVYHSQKEADQIYKVPLRDRWRHWLRACRLGSREWPGRATVWWKCVAFTQSG